MRQLFVTHRDEGYLLVIEDVPPARVAAECIVGWSCWLTKHALCSTEWGSLLLWTVADTSDYERARVPLTTVQAKALAPSFVDDVIALDSYDGDGWDPSADDE